MEDLSKLNVSLTKHGILKLTTLIELHDTDEILKNVWGKHEGININAAQVKKVLSVDKNGVVPKVWDNIKKFGHEDIQDCVFISIIFSHHRLIEAVIKGNNGNCIIKKGEFLDTKEYTNFAGILDNYGFAIEHNSEFVSYDISRIFYKPYLVEYIRQILALKLIKAGWDKETSDIAAGVKNGFHLVFALNNKEYSQWLSKGKKPSFQSIKKVKASRNFPQGIKFRAGHNNKFEGSRHSQPKESQIEITYLHNKIQNEVFEILNSEYPGQVGTEVLTNNGSVDIVADLDKEFVLYEIKTSKTSRANIRQGLSQILEYAYFGDPIQVSKLVIIGPAKCSNASKEYLSLLRERFGIPIFYQSFNLETNELSALD